MPSVPPAPELRVATPEATEDIPAPADLQETARAPRRVPLRWRLWPSSRLERASAAVFAVAILLVLAPVLFAPVNADERFQYFVAEVKSHGSFLQLFAWSWHDIPANAAQGRITPLGFLAQRIAYFLGLNSSVTFGVPLVVAHAAIRLTLLCVVLWAVRSLLVRVRARGPEGAAVGLAPERVRVVLATTALVFALGATVQDQFSNGLVTYPVLTYTALALMIGFPAILLGLLRRLATSWSVPLAVAAFAVAALLGAVLNISYELYYVAFPTMVAALVLQYVQGGARRAKALLLGGVVLGFGVMFAWTRSILAAACAHSACYAGVQPQLDGGAVRTAVLNIVNATPVAGWGAARRDLTANGLGDLYPDWHGNELSVVVLVAAAAWAVLVLAAFRRWSPAVPGEARAVVKAMVVVAGAGIGSAVVMAVSAQAQVRIGGLGVPYRNTFATWGSLALGAVLVAVFVALLLRGRRRALAPFAVVAALAVGIGVFQFPLNAAVTRAHEVAPGVSLPRRVADEVTYGERGAAADARRCALVAEARTARIGRTAQRRLMPAAAQSFQRLHGFPFCRAGLTAGK
ncbi:MAG TPA: hypothetical protein VGP02_13330 [Mycobacteriales bacterium]|nr:hypothetical protein [Mycobacteriales bacterium]